MERARPRILVVEDNPDLLELTGAILGQQADVECTSDTAQALRQVATTPYDVLVTDLNILGPHDGLLLACAARRLQPAIRTVLISGYPDFTRAVASMQETLDVTLLKPVDTGQLRDAALGAPPLGAHTHLGEVSLWRVLEESKDDILSAWLQAVENDQELRQISLSPSQRLDHVQALVEQLAGHGAGPQDSSHTARRHGSVRRQQRYSAELLALELSYLRREILKCMLGHLLELDLSRLPGELLTVSTHLDAALFASLREFELMPAQAARR